MSVKKSKKTCTGRSFAQFENSALTAKEKQTVKGGNASYTGGTEVIILQ
ncbi:MAG: hypothetical protein AB8G11_06135 [Saprospiraceae bacterium]